MKTEYSKFLILMEERQVMEDFLGQKHSNRRAGIEAPLQQLFSKVEVMANKTMMKVKS